MCPEKKIFKYYCTQKKNCKKKLTFGASNLILALPFTNVADNCIITASIVYAAKVPIKYNNFIELSII